MVLVAIVGLGMGIEGLRRRLSALSDQYRLRAAEFRKEAQFEADMASARTASRNYMEGIGGNFPPGNPMDESIARLHRRSAHYRALSGKYDRAARYPWLEIAPDPAEPE
jgi:hypothetical protein